MIFEWNEEKNEELSDKRGVSFERVVTAIGEGKLMDILEPPNQLKYESQRILVVDIDGYAFCIPFIESKDRSYFLKTIFPSRKYTRIYLHSDE
jgi:uncharacterized DUF497 family protein